MKRKATKILSLLLCAIFLFALCQTALAANISYYMAATKTTPLYSSASTSASNNGTLSAGDVMGVISASGGFYYVYIGGRYGYVLTSDCTTTTSTTITSASSVSKYLSTVVSTYLYSSATLGATYYTSIPAGTSVAILSTSGDFYNALYNGYTGYVPVSAFSAASGTVLYYLTTGSSASLYATASTTGTVYATVIPGANVGIIQSYDTNFYKVFYGNYTGYMLKSAFTGFATNSTTITPATSAYGAVCYGSVGANTPLLSTPGGATKATFPSGGSIGIVSQTGTGYYYVKGDGYEGYVAATNVSLASSVTIPTVAATGSSATTESGGKSATIKNCKTNVNFRSAPSSSGTLLGAIKKGEAVTAYGKTGKYTKISYGGQVGYVLSKYVK